MRCIVEVSHDEFEAQEREPVCGEDFCDQCGDCLHCDFDSPCYSDGSDHTWVIYNDFEKEK
jgi:hypothetical protein